MQVLLPNPSRKLTLGGHADQNKQEPGVVAIRGSTLSFLQFTYYANGLPHLLFFTEPESLTCGSLFRRLCIEKFFFPSTRKKTSFEARSLL